MERTTDELMWLLAESRDPGAIESFLRQHPQFEAELSKRMRMVQDLKGMKPTGKLAAIPNFVPTSVAPIAASKPAWTKWILPMAPACALAIGFGVWIANRPSPSVAVIDEPTSEVTTKGFKESESRDPAVSEPVTPLPNDPGTVQPAHTKVPDPVERTVTINGDSTTVMMVLNEITQQTGTQFEIAPGFEDMPVRVEYTNMPVMQALENLGQTAGFTAFSQGPNQVLIVPARQDQPQKQPTLNDPTQESPNAPGLEPGNPAETNPAPNPRNPSPELPAPKG